MVGGALPSGTPCAARSRSRFTSRPPSCRSSTAAYSLVAAALALAGAAPLAERLGSRTSSLCAPLSACLARRRLERSRSAAWMQPRSHSSGGLARRRGVAVGCMARGDARLVSLRRLRCLRSGVGSRAALPPEAVFSLDIAGIGSLLEDLPVRVSALGALGPAYFCAAFVLSCCLLLPVTPLIISAGYLFGSFSGVAYATVAICAAASVTFLLSRTLLRQQVENSVAKDEQFRKINAAAECEGFKIILLLRLSPLLPFAATSYVLGLSGVSFAEYLLATLFGYFPWTVILVCSSTIAQTLFGADMGVPWYAYAIGLLLTAGLLWWAAKILGDAVDSAVDVGGETCALDNMLADDVT